MSTPSNPYRGFRYPAEIINQAVWLYHCFSLSLREVELILAARGIVVSYETIREWSLRFGRAYANSLKKRRPKPGDKWFLDEVFVRIRGKLYYLWRAVDQHGNVLDVLVQSRRNTKAAKRFFRKLLKGLCYAPRVIVTDKLDPMTPPNVRSCRALNIARAGISTTAVRCPINRPDGANAT
jgi:putative transposase